MRRYDTAKLAGVSPGVIERVTVDQVRAAGIALPDVTPHPLLFFWHYEGRYWMDDETRGPVEELTQEG